MNSIGLQNPGVEWFIEHELADMLTIDTLTLVNLGGHSMVDYITGAQLLDKTEAPVIELNISCPNVDAGAGFGIGAMARRRLSAVRATERAQSSYRPMRKTRRWRLKAGADAMNGHYLSGDGDRCPCENPCFTV